MIVNGRDFNAAALFMPPYVLSPERYESPLEHRFAHHAVKYLRAGLELQTQVEVETRRGRYWLDFLVRTEDSSVAFECDGAEFHNGPQAYRDDLRDAAILETGHVDTIYRIGGKYLTFRPEDCFYAISRWNPELFSDRGLANLCHLASVELTHTTILPEHRGTECRYDYCGDDVDRPNIGRFYIERRVPRRSR